MIKLFLLFPVLGYRRKKIPQSYHNQQGEIFILISQKSSSVMKDVRKSVMQWMSYIRVTHP